MPRTPVQSSMISYVAHDADTNALTVTFNNGKSYVYENVPVDEYHALVNAPSVGKHFIDNIRDQYRTR